MAVVGVSALLPATTLADNYVVGDDDGWNLGVDYDHWASGKDFKVGDLLQFLYSASFHNVVLVDATSYETCTVPKDAEMLTTGHDRVRFRRPGQQFYICGFEGHCQSGMKLAINVR